MEIVKEKEIAPCICVYENAFTHSSFYLQKIKNLHWNNMENVNLGVMLDEEYWPEIYELSRIYSKHYSEKYKIRYEKSEPPHAVHYEKNKGFLYAHADSVPERRREFSAVVYLNDVEYGGETIFNNFNVSVSPKAGTLVMFPANYAYEHEASVPKDIDKYAISIWYS
jgi:hypothetical protein